MKTRIALLPALATVLAGILVSAPAAAQEAKVISGQVKDAVKSEATLGVPLLFSVEGLTKENLEKVTRSLMTLTENVYMCSSCKHMQSTAGVCTPCDVELEAKKEPILFEAEPSLKKANVQLTAFAARTLCYSDLQGALKKNSIKINEAKLPLPGHSRLVLRGGSLEDVEAIETALDDCGSFDSVKASYDPISTEIHVAVHALATPPMYGKVAAIIEVLDTQAKLVDVIWGPQPIPAKI